jgi:hypothetical protein
LRGNLNNMRTGERSADAAMGHLSPEGDDSRLCPQTDVFYLKVGETVVVQYSVRGRVSPRRPRTTATGQEETLLENRVASAWRQLPDAQFGSIDRPDTRPYGRPLLLALSFIGLRSTIPLTEARGIDIFTFSFNLLPITVVSRTVLPEERMDSECLRFPTSVPQPPPSLGVLLVHCRRLFGQPRLSGAVLRSTLSIP